MSKATIVSEIGNGQYAVKLEYDSQYLDDIVSAIAQQLIDIEQDVLDAQVELIDLRATRQSLANDLDDAIEAYRTAVETNPTGADSSPVTAATKALAAAAAAVDLQVLKVNKLQSRKLSMARRKTFLENLSSTQQPDAGTLAWCADFSEGETGTVPVALIPGEISGSSWVVLPRQHPDGYGAAYDRESFGQLVPRMSMTPEATLYNWAMLPGWQRWMPTFRHATIEAVYVTGNESRNSNTCDIVLDTARSSANPYPWSNGLNVNLAESTATRLENVPIRYMTCDALAFQEGDRVLVRFKSVASANAGPANWDQPEVIGFVSSPRNCGVGLDLYFVVDCSSSMDLEHQNTAAGVSELNTWFKSGPTSAIPGGYDHPIPGIHYWGFYAYGSIDPDYDDDLKFDLQQSAPAVAGAIGTAEATGLFMENSFDSLLAAMGAVTWRDETSVENRRIVILITDDDRTGSTTEAQIVSAFQAVNAELIIVITGGGLGDDFSPFTDLADNFLSPAFFEEFAEDLAQVIYTAITNYLGHGVP